MTIQILLFVAIMAITLLYSGKQGDQLHKRRCVTLCTVILTLFSGLRSWWMGDLIKYYTLFRNCAGPQWRDYVFEKPENIGIRLFFRLVGSLHLPYELCIFLIAAFTAITLGILIYRYSPSPFWSYVMYIGMGFYLFTYTGLKQTVAMAFLVLAMMALLEDRMWKFLLLTALGGVFHAPAFIFLLAYPLSRKKLNLTYIFMLLAFVALVFAFRDQIVHWLSDLYYDDEDTLVANKFVGGRFLMMVFILILSQFLRPVHGYDTVYYRVFNIMILAAVLQTFSVYDNNFTRLTDYYFQFVVLFMPMMLENGNNPAWVCHEVPGRSYIFGRGMYRMLYMVVAMFAVYYYIHYIGSSTAILKDYLFVWQIDPYSLYGA